MLMILTSRMIAARDRRLTEASMPRPVPTTQTGSLTDNQRGTNDTLILGTGTGRRDLRLPSMAMPWPCTTTSAAAMTR